MSDSGGSGDAAASIGSIAAFLGLQATLLTGAACIVEVQGRTDENGAVLVFVTLGLISALGGKAIANPGLARGERGVLMISAVWMWRVSVLMGVMAVALVLARIMPR